MKRDATKDLCNYIYNSYYFYMDKLDLNIIKKYLDDGADINYKNHVRCNYIEALIFDNENLTVLKCLLEAGIEYEFILQDEDYDKNSPHIKYLQKYHDSKLLKEKLENELKSTDVKTKRGKI